MSTENEPVAEPSKSDIILKIGRAIEERRKSRGLTLERMTQSIKIKVSFLKAIETGDWKELPGEVYARGFVIRYANFLGLDGKALLAPYIDFQSSAEKKSPAPSQGPQSYSSFPKGAYIWAGVVLVVFIGLIKFIATDLRSAKKVENIQPPIAAAASPTATPVVASVPKKALSHSINVFSTLPLWLSVKAETRSFEGFLPQGSTWSWKADGEFVIRLGHTQQVTMEFDGKPVLLDENKKKISLPSEN